MEEEKKDQVSTLAVEMKGLMNEIIEGELFLGSARGSRNRDLLKKLGVKTIINCQEDAVKSFPEDFTYHLIFVEDDEEEALHKHFSTVYDIIEKAEKPVYVHCFAGISRSPSITISYIMKKKNMSYKEAYDYVFERRPIDPNSGFVKQLKAYEEELKKGGGNN